MSYQEFVEDLKKIILPLLEEENAVLVELNFRRAKEGLTLKLLVDKKSSGISLQDCARLNERIGNLLDEQDTIKERYILEVSSPGLDRELLSKEDFLRCINRKVKFFLSESINGKREIDGLIKKVENEAVYVDREGEIFEIPLSKITKAKQVMETGSGLRYKNGE